MLLTTFTILLSTLSTQTLAAFTDTANLGITYQATSLGNNTAQICITAKNITNTTWIGLGIPADPMNPVMFGADIVIVYPDSDAAGGVSVLHGYGITENGENDVDDVAVNGSDGDEVQVAGVTSSYTNNTIQACFTRPMLIDAPTVNITTGTNSTTNTTENTARNLTDSITSYIWATGKLVDGDAQQHTLKGSIKNVNLFGDLAGVSTGVNANGNNTGNAKSQAAGTGVSYNVMVVLVSWSVCIAGFLGMTMLG
ncbi:hypothetical protein HDU76_009563 [Blyttiomyces sp. JEL0837]|nr:hypothetical protein HDU76_009563 [Blyttiomyces sp. JEL0837]